MAKKLKRRSWGFGVITAVCLLVLGGCVSTTPVFYSNNSQKEFTILGEVVYESGSRYGFIELLKAAKSQYPDCDYVVDVMVDGKVTKFFGAKYTYVMRGLAIKYTN